MRLFNNRLFNVNPSMPTWRKYCKYIYYGIIMLYFLARHVNSASEELEGGEKKVIGRYKVASFNYDHVADLYAIVLWILLGAFVKVGKYLQYAFVCFMVLKRIINIIINFRISCSSHTLHTRKLHFNGTRIDSWRYIVPIKNNNSRCIRAQSGHIFLLSFATDYFRSWLFHAQ